MTQQARVPKFGNWESDDNVPYTQYFDNARKGKVGGKLINPNDPQENPESFATPQSRTSSEYDDLKLKVLDILPPPGSPLRHDVVTRKLSDPHRRANRMSAGSERSIENSPLHPNNQPKSGGRAGMNPSCSWEKRGSLEGRGLAPSTPGRARTGSAGRGEEMVEKGSTVPKFGEWDESDPSSADGYTHIFNKVREEKQVGSEKVPTMSNEPSYRRSKHKRAGNYESSGCGCFGWMKN